MSRLLSWWCMRVMWMDSRGIHDIDGLMIHHWNGEEHIVSYDEIVQIVVPPYVKYASLSYPTDETYFAWGLVFMTEKEE